KPGMPNGMPMPLCTMFLSINWHANSDRHHTMPGSLSTMQGTE
ncbi:32003_t:CDS:1, partial [Racocetra persica]